ncbi:MAG: DUF4919 domain-containing protein [Bacteroidales bacterium]|nr:DUF4919 domain-containing protein [Bacteroidales bacterium]
MNHIKSLLTIAALSMATFAMAQSESIEQLYDRYDKIEKAEESDTTEIRVLIEDWEKASLNEADLYFLKYYYEYTKVLSQDVKELTYSTQKIGDYGAIVFEKDIKLSAFDAAFQILDEGIDKYPNRLDFRLYRAFVQFKTHENDKALETLSQIISHSKEIKENWLEGHNKPIEGGYEVFEEYMNEGFGFFWESNDFTNAKVYADSLVAAYPQSFLFRVNHAAINAALCNYDQAINEFLSLEKEDPKNEYCIFCLAQLYADTGNEEKTKEYCDKAIALDEENAPKAESIMKRFETVKVDFDEIKEYMKDHEADYRAIEKKFVAGDPDMSLRDLSILYYGHALTPECTSTILWNINADSLFQNEKYEELLKVCEETLEKHPASLAANLFASMCSEHLNNPNEDLYYLRCRQIGRMIYYGAGRMHEFFDGDNTESKEGVENADTDNNDRNPRIFKILWRADENAFVDYMLSDKDKKEGLFFSEPVYFISKDIE